MDKKEICRHLWREGWTREEIARELGIHVITVSRYTSKKTTNCIVCKKEVESGKKYCGFSCYLSAGEGRGLSRADAEVEYLKDCG